MRDWIDQLRFMERVAIVILVFVIVILEIADIGFAELGKVVFEKSRKCVMVVNGSPDARFSRGATSRTQ